jgi:hypothetical protein
VRFATAKKNSVVCCQVQVEVRRQTTVKQPMRDDFTKHATASSQSTMVLRSPLGVLAADLGSAESGQCSSGDQNLLRFLDGFHSLHQKALYGDGERNSRFAAHRCPTV